MDPDRMRLLYDPKIGLFPRKTKAEFVSAPDLSNSGDVATILLGDLHQPLLILNACSGLSTAVLFWALDPISTVAVVLHRAMSCAHDSSLMQVVAWRLFHWGFLGYFILWRQRSASCSASFICVQPLADLHARVH